MYIKHMDSKQTAKHLGVSIGTLRRWVHQEGLPVLKFPGRRKWTFRQDLVDEWVERRSIPQIINDPKENKEYGKLRILSP